METRVIDERPRRNYEDVCMHREVRSSSEGCIVNFIDHMK